MDRIKITEPLVAVNINTGEFYTLKGKSRIVKDILSGDNTYLIDVTQSNKMVETVTYLSQFLTNVVPDRVIAEVAPENSAVFAYLQFYGKIMPKSVETEVIEVQPIESSDPVGEVLSTGRGFQVVDPAFQQNENQDSVILPIRGTQHSAGYDFFAPQHLIIPPNKAVFISFDVKAYMRSDEYLSIHMRSSIGIKRQLMLANTTGIIDSDYYSNPDNDGNIGAYVYNYGDKTQVVAEGERFIQGIFQKYLLAEHDAVTTTRKGGTGHTGL